MSGFTSHPLCLEARHAILAETLALAEDLSTLREVRSFRHFGVNRLSVHYVLDDRSS